ncbi:MAG: deoxyhypusine synthase family protein [Desulfovibrionales bacterium]
MTKKKNDIRRIDQLHDPSEFGLKSLSPLDPDAIDDFDDLLQAMSRTSFDGRRMGEALDVMESMVSDPDCVVVGTFSGAMTVAKMGLLLSKMIDKGWINIVVSTGALMAHGFIESIGLKHYKYEPGKMNDATLYQQGFNRVYDTLEPEKNFMEAERIIHKVMEGIDAGETLSSTLLCRRIGKYLSENMEGPGILKSAYESNVPVYIPAFTDSELALDVATHILRKAPEALKRDPDPDSLPYFFNPFLDLMSYTKHVCRAKRVGIFTIGGGVPRNWAQQVGPFIEIVNQRLPEMDLDMKKFHYGVRICPEPVHWGGLSGCTYQEGISWGKFVSPQDGGKYAEVLCDATIAWPLLIKGLQDRLKKRQG